MEISTFAVKKLTNGPITQPNVYHGNDLEGKCASLRIKLKMSSMVDDYIYTLLKYACFTVVGDVMDESGIMDETIDGFTSKSSC